MAQGNEEFKGQTETAYAQGDQEVGAVTEKTAEKTKKRVQPYLSDRKEQFVQQLNQTAGALRETGTHMDDNRGGDLIRISADKIEQLGAYLGTRDIDELIDDLKSFARSRPWAVMGGAFVIGLAAARFMKAGGRPTGS
ncbi:MAG: hypothetical protein C4519_00565 [Desulfobacteraceae bacterium]|nr:MAG: hypothetical protein C4519_00565 [Desulfobacteraceae bacterium]